MELIDSRGGVVTREQLISKLWPKGIVDFDTGLNTAIRKLRVALGDTADTPRYIETFPRRGYRFIAALDAGLEPSPSLAPAPQQSPPWVDTPPRRAATRRLPRQARPPRLEPSPHPVRRTGGP